MKKTSLFLTLSLLFAVLLFPNGKNAGTAFNREGYTCTESRGGEEIRLTFQLQDYTLNRGAVNVDGKMCDSISYKHGVEPVEPGVPAAPYTVRSIIIPGNAEMTLEITGAKYKDIEGITLIPSTPARCDRDYPARCDRDYRFGSTYSRDQFYPGSPAAIGRPYILRNFRGVAVYFYPFRYNPVRGILRVAESITVTVKKTGTSVFNVLEKKESDTNSDKDKRNDVYIANAIDSKKKVRGIIKPFDRIYSDHFVNYRDSLHTESYPAVMETGSMMVITTDEYRSAVEPLVVWKNRKGIKTDLYIYPTDTGSSAIRLKDFIQRKYDSGGLAYILIVGDAADVPPGNGTIATARGTASDPVYTLLAGDDDYADAMIGRFSVSDITQAQTVVNKNLWYEKTPDVNGEWYHKALGLAGDDRFFTPNPRELMEEIQAMMLGFPYTEFTMLKDPGCMKSQFTGAIEEGRGWININYHGTRSGWMRWVGSLDYLFSSTDVLQLENTGKTPVVISNSCSNGEFESRTCFAETWQRLGTPDEPGGSIVFVGASSAIWHLAWVAQKEIIRHLVQKNYTTIGGMVTNGIMKMVEFFPNGPHYEGAETFQLWHIFGDPSLVVYTDTPAEMDVQYGSALTAGVKSFTVKVSEEDQVLENALVALYMNGVLYGSAYTGVSGYAAVQINATLPDSGSMEVNVTASNKIPYSGTVEIVAIEEKSLLNPKKIYIIK